MMFRSVSEIEVQEVYNYYLTYTKERTQYVPLEYSDFYHNLIEDKITVISVEESIQGFISGVQQDDTVYISLCYGEEDTCLKLITEFEIIAQSTQATMCKINFFNPIWLPWYPLKNIQHPCYQGVLLDSVMHRVYQSLGYENYSIQETYYLDLLKFQAPLFHQLDPRFSITMYDPSIHTSFTTFLDELDSPHWKSLLSKNQALENPVPLIVVLDGLSVIGFSGPVYVEDSKRGYFAGIGILKEYRKMHIGKNLFMTLCQTLKELGAEYMTFYTGDTNPAKYIYTQATGTVVARFMTLKKTL